MFLKVFLSSTFLCLARESAGCSCTLTRDDKCEGRAYGMSPSALLTNIAIISGILSAVFMPVIGAMIDYTPYRRHVGIISSALIIIIQAIKIGTNSKTWFIMILLQGFTGFLYQIHLLASYAYLPDIGRTVDHNTLTNCKFFFS